MNRSTDPWASLIESMRRFRSGWPSRGWTWDSRLACIASTFSVADEDQARNAAAHALPTTWTEVTMRAASPALKSLADRYGGVRSGQLLLTGSSYGHVTPFGLWWPWGNGETISMRIGLDGVDELQEPFHRLRDVFDAGM
jgi:hypothetical protein